MSTSFILSEDGAFALMGLMLGFCTALLCILLKVTLDFLSIVYDIWRCFCYQAFVDFVCLVYPALEFLFNIALNADGS